MCKNCGASFNCLCANNTEKKVCTLFRYPSPSYFVNETYYPQRIDTHLLATNITEGKFLGVVILKKLQTPERLLLMLAGMVVTVAHNRVALVAQTKHPTTQCFQGNLQNKQTEIYWSFFNIGGDPRPKYFRFLPVIKHLQLINGLYDQKNVTSEPVVQ